MCLADRTGICEYFPHNFPPKGKNIIVKGKKKEDQTK